jgi:hypothetical protein
MPRQVGHYQFEARDQRWVDVSPRFGASGKAMQKHQRSPRPRRHHVVIRAAEIKLKNFSRKIKIRAERIFHKVPHPRGRVWDCGRAPTPVKRER